MRRKVTVRRIKDYVSKKTFEDLDDAIEALMDTYNMERSLNELRKGTITEMEYYEQELHICEILNFILQLKQIKTLRKHG